MRLPNAVALDEAVSLDGLGSEFFVFRRFEPLPIQGPCPVGVLRDILRSQVAKVLDVGALRPDGLVVGGERLLRGFLDRCFICKDRN